MSSTIDSGSPERAAAPRRRAPPRTKQDVIVVGGGPAGAVAAWTLARQGVRVAVIERARFPREKVCGDFVEPAGLRILASMGCLSPLESTAPLPITRSRAFIDARQVYCGKVPYYGSHDPSLQERLPAHGYIVPREQLDLQLLDAARAAGAVVYDGCAAKHVTRDSNERMQVDVDTGSKQMRLMAPLVVGADGTESIVARSAGLNRHDPRYLSVSQRGYVDGIDVEHGEATIWFDAEMYPGYGWLFPMAGGMANVGVGVLSEACARHGLSVPTLFRAFIEKLRRHHPGCAGIRLQRRPLGGIVKAYGGIGPNHFDGGLLIGDAGSFVDPMTGEGITQGMESAQLAATTLLSALANGRFDANQLGQYERDFRAYFDPSMRLLDLCATVMRNRYLSEFWLRSVTRGFHEATVDPTFARVAGAAFGGLELRPTAVLSQVMAKVGRHIARGSAGALLDALSGRQRSDNAFVDDFDAWRRGMLASLRADPAWHFGWLRDVAGKSTRLLWTSQSPRLHGPGRPHGAARSGSNSTSATRPS